jgi:hypothetical protein
MIKPHFAGDPEQAQRVAKCREGAERCLANATESEDWREEKAWLDLASAWTDLEKAFESEYSLVWLN